MTKFKEIEIKVLKEISPTIDESKKIETLANNFTKTLQKELSEAKVIVGGSVVKGTFFKNKTDIDVFVKFNYQKHKANSNKLANMLEAALKNAFPKIKINRVNGSRDYFQLKYENFMIEVIPILDIKESKEAVNITDISPLHAVWVNKQPDKIKDQIRLTKQFAKANDSYGAESYIGGFSGYILELLTIHYGSFQALLEAAVNWKEKQVIDIEGYHNGKDIFMEIDIAKLYSPIIIVDPTDKFRNAAAALTKEKWKIFKKAAKEYLASPSEEFFKITPITFDGAKSVAEKKKRKLLYCEIISKDGKPDVIGCKLLKVIEHLQTKLKGFAPKEMQWHWEMDENLMKFYLCFAKKTLPKEEIKRGPPTNLEEAVDMFKEKNKDFEIFEKDKHLFAKVPIKVRDLESNIKKQLESAYVRERIKEIKNVKIIV